MLDGVLYKPTQFRLFFFYLTKQLREKWVNKTKTVIFFVHSAYAILNYVNMLIICFDVERKNLLATVLDIHSGFFFFVDCCYYYKHANTHRSNCVLHNFLDFSIPSMLSAEAKKKNNLFAVSFGFVSVLYSVCVCFFFYFVQVFSTCRKNMRWAEK